MRNIIPIDNRTSYPFVNWGRDNNYKITQNSLFRCVSCYLERLMATDCTSLKIAAHIPTDKQYCISKYKVLL